MENVKLLDEYFDRFGESFPMMQAPNMEEAKKHLEACLEKGKAAGELFPQVYGALDGVYV